MAPKPTDKQPKKKVTKEMIKKEVDDSTFGMKNKNKSKKVQEFINRVEKSVKYNTGAADAVRVLFNFVTDIILVFISILLYWYIYMCAIHPNTIYSIYLIHSFYLSTNLSIYLGQG